MPRFACLRQLAPNLGVEVAFSGESGLPVPGLRLIAAA